MFRKAFHRFFGSASSATATAFAAPPMTRPACLTFDSEEQSDFGTQVATLLTLDPDAWVVHASLRRFYYLHVGEFAYDENDRLQHQGDPHVREGMYTDPGRQRALTHGDHVVITEALKFLLQRPMAEKAKQADPFAGIGQAAGQAAQQAGLSAFTPNKIWNGAPAVPTTAYQQLQQEKNRILWDNLDAMEHAIRAQQAKGQITQIQAEEFFKAAVNSNPLATQVKMPGT
jgi:hypothetical protein